MNSSYSITTKYQVTIPKEVRKKMGVKSNDKVKFIKRGGKFYLERVETLDEIVKELQNDFKKSGLQPATQADIDNAKEKFLEEGGQW